MKITIIGGGNIGTLMAAEFACKGHDVTMYTSKPDGWQREVSVYDRDDNILFKGKLTTITDSMQKAVEDAEYIWVTTPAMLFSRVSENMLPYVHSGQKIGVVPGSGGAEFAFRGLMKKGCILFGLQRVHSIARIKEYGKKVYELGRKPEIQIGAIPSSAKEDICNVVRNLFNMPCASTDNYLSITLTPSNPILHTARLYSIFKEYTLGVTYPRNFLFYEEWTDDSSEILLACDKELQILCDVIPLDLSSVKSLREHYESKTIAAMTKKISGINAFKGLTSPMKKVDKGWVPDWDSRYFTTDFSFGLKIIKDIAGMFKVPTLHMDKIWDWYVETANPDRAKVFSMQLDTKSFLEIY